MLDPIGTPTGRYPNSVVPVPDHPNLPKWVGSVEIADPDIVSRQVPWHPGSAGHGGPDKAAEYVKRIMPGTVPTLDRPEIGGRITVCVLCYGKHFELHKRCLNSILRTVPNDRVDIRVGCNDVGPDTLQFARGLPGVTKLYNSMRNKFKYPAMREMFHDKSHPITTKFTVWFDDNTWVVHDNWLNILADDIARQDVSVGAYGPLIYYPLRMNRSKDPRAWFKGGEWHRGKDFRTRRGVPAPNGDTIHFCHDWFFVVKTEAITKADIPDARLVQRGGNIVIGEQLYQNGWKIKQFNSDKKLVFTLPHGQGMRRGRKELFPWQ